MLFALAGLGRTSAQNKNFFFFFSEIERLVLFHTRAERPPGPRIVPSPSPTGPGAGLDRARRKSAGKT